MGLLNLSTAGDNDELPETNRTGKNELGKAWVVPDDPNPTVHSPVEVLKCMNGVLGKALGSIDGLYFDRSCKVWSSRTVGSLQLLMPEYVKEFSNN